MLSKYTHAQCFAGFVGLVFLVGGIIGLTTVDGGNTFSHGGNIDGGKLLMFEGNGWSSLLLIVTGALGVLTAFHAQAAKTFALVVGAISLVLAVWGIIDDNTVMNIFPVNRADNVLDLGVGLVGLVVGLTSGPGKRHARVNR